jgi:hypothetical protein
VRTPLYESSSPIGHALMDASAITPDEVAAAVIEGIADGRFLILPHPRSRSCTRAGPPIRTAG